MDRREILLREYECCQQEDHHLMNHYWTIFGILASGNTITIGLLASTTQFELRSLSSVIGILVLAVVAIAMLHYLRLYRRRVDFRIIVNYERMREIEFDLGMWRNWRIHGIDDQEKRMDKHHKYQEKISTNDQVRLLAYHPESWWQDWVRSKDYQKPIGKTMADVIICALQILWAVSAVIVLICFVSDC